MVKVHTCPVGEHPWMGPVVGQARHPAMLEVMEICPEHYSRLPYNEGPGEYGKYFFEVNQ